VTLELADLTKVLEEELSVGAELRRNLAGQKDAIIAWDIAALLTQLEAREVWLNTLGTLEQRRRRILTEDDPGTEPSSLRLALAPLADGSADKSRLLALGERMRHVFAELKDEEGQLHKLMGNLLAHLDAALSPLLQPLTPTYGENGAADRQRPLAALLRSRA
jgi:hypothetical protein